MDNAMSAFIEKAKTATSAHELQNIASAADVQISAEQAEKLYEQLSSGSELSDEDLDNISSGIALSSVLGQFNMRFI